MYGGLQQQIQSTTVAADTHAAEIYYSNSVVYTACYTAHFSFIAIRKRDTHGNKKYREMNSGDGQYKIKLISSVQILLFRCFEQISLNVLLQNYCHVGGTVLPVIFHPDEAYFSFFRVDKIAYPIYITFDNIYLEVHNKSSKVTIVLLVLILVTTKSASESSAADQTSLTFYVNQLQQVLELVL